MTKRTTIKVDDELDARMRHEAARRGLTLSEWVREAIEAHLPGADDVPAGEIRRTFRSTAAGRSGRSDISERMEELLAGLADGRDILAEEEAAEALRESAA
ncbi:ribbon-helix-helix domain-containing protein [Streptomyces bambusae]|uniref:ribbon-helix-helix domain-containing protein n=1 Tax=Streptomyces bambusae TaxID=1550616 RepID=UPI001D000F4C|nr:CopG family transcriptional regulator [Streptomyces bambusae]MCB5169268.1 ribbon-helix-helix domain-containing protein [Streptomyces bambusae]